MFFVHKTDVDELNKSDKTEIKKNKLIGSSERH